MTRATYPTSIRRRRAPRGFSFVEVLFAVIVLGIGFIMIAAVFPVAISQTKTTTDETTAAAIAREGVNYLSNIPRSSSLMPHTHDTAASPGGTGRVYSFRDLRLSFPGQRSSLWDAVRGSLILPSDNRYAWVPLFKRDTDPTTAVASAYAQVFVVATQIRNRSIYTQANDAAPLPLAPPVIPTTLEPRPVSIILTEGNGAPDQITIDDITTGALAQAGASMAAAEGTFVIISDDRNFENATTTVIEAGQANGRIYRLGNFISRTGTASTWELAPGYDMSYTNPDTIVANADDINENLPPRDVGAAPVVANAAYGFIIGRALTAPTMPYAAGSNDYEGPAQDIAIYTTFVRVN